jgi:AcrR family transcriptional regulator
VAIVTTAQTADRDDSRPVAYAAGSPHRQRLLDALAQSIAEDGYRATTVADIVRRARTSRRTFYEHFADKEACFIALLTGANADVIRRISGAVDRTAPPETQIQQAITAWIEAADSRPTLMLSWIRDSPTLGAKTRRLQRDLQESFVVLLRDLTDTAELRAAGIGPVSRQMAIVLLGGLRELIAVTVEDGGSMSDIRDAGIQASLALLGQRRETFRAPPGPSASGDRSARGTP